MKNKLYLEFNYKTDEELSHIVETIKDGNIEFKINANKIRKNWFMSVLGILIRPFVLVFEWFRGIDIYDVAMFIFFSFLVSLVIIVGYGFTIQSFIPTEFSRYRQCYLNNRYHLDKNIKHYRLKLKNTSNLQQIKLIKSEFNKEIETFCEGE